ncbi:MAG: integrin alpha [Thermoanaerobaculia bacterium]|nr:integrin alpha [Thermoanaerobaculia bacterium]
MLLPFRKSLRLGIQAALVAWIVPAQAETPPSAVPKAQGHVQFHQKISQTSGGFTGTLTNNDGLGFSVAALGDLDGDGVTDLVAGAPFDGDGGLRHGAVWILFLDANGFVRTQQKISDTQGGFTGLLHSDNRLGEAVTSLGDLDGDGVPDLAVGTPRDEAGGGPERGAVWILFLRANGTVKAHQKISDIEGGFTGTLDALDHFGEALASPGDLDGDGLADLVVGAPQDDDGGGDRGAVWILFLHPNGTVKAHQKISATEGGFAGTLDDLDLFGRGVAALGDLDGDGQTDLAVHSLDDDGGLDRGAVWILFLNPDSTVRAHQKISATEGNFNGHLNDQDAFGSSLAPLGDLDCDGVVDLAAGTRGDDTGGTNRGAVWIPFLSRTGTVRLHAKISQTSGGFTGTLDDQDRFGASVAPLGDLDGDGSVDLAVGAFGDGDGGSGRGAVWILFLDNGGCVDPFLFSDGFESGTTAAWSEPSL